MQYVIYADIHTAELTMLGLGVTLSKKESSDVFTRCGFRKGVMY